MPGYEPTHPPDSKLPPSPRSAFPDPLIWLAHAGAVTTTIKLATGILILPQHNPVVLAKAVATLDRLTEGRLLLGIGVGWLREEAEAVGIPFEGRGFRAEEFIGAMRALWTEDVASYAGEHVRFASVRSYPKPVAKDQRVPILVGGGGLTAARRAGRLGDGYYPVTSDADRLAELLDAMRRSAEDAGRDPDAVEVTIPVADLAGEDPVSRKTLDMLHHLESIGVHRVVVPLIHDLTTEKAIESLDRLSVQLIDAYR